MLNIPDIERKDKEAPYQKPKTVKPQYRYYIQIPEKVAEILPILEVNPPFKGFQLDNLRLILSIISTHQRKDCKDNNYAQLKMQFLRKKVWNADLYIKYLIDVGIIDRIGGYTPGDHAYKYQYNSAYQSAYVKSELHNQKLINKIHRLKSISGRRNCRKYSKQSQLIKSMTVNFDAAIKLSKEKFPDEDKVKKLDYALGAITRIQNGEFYIKVDDTGNRLHTNLTNLPKFLRGVIQIKDKYISGVDIRNSQPYISTKFLSNPESAKEFFPGNYPLMMLKCLRLPEQQDVKRFLSLTSQAEFYNYLEAEFNKRGLRYEGDELKTKIFQVLFDKNHHTSKEKRIFFELFPSVEKAFSVLRMAKYTDFVNSLQRMESYVVLDVILNRLNFEHPDMVATPIYDSICTSIAADDIETVRKVMTEELTKFVGMPPVLKVENFDRPLF